MPPVIPAVVAAAGAAAAGTTVLGLSVTASALAIGAGSLALGLVSSALAPKPELPDLSSFASIRSRGVTQQINQPVTERRIVYGEARVSGPLAYYGVTDNNKYLHMAVMLASHEVESIDTVWINETPITDDMLDINGVVNTGRYDGIIRINKHLGTSTQTADTDMVSDISEWTTDHRLRSIAYVYVRFEWDRDKFPSGIPNISAWVKGKKITDTRDSTEKWTPNVALQAYDYLTYDWEFEGLGLEVGNIDTDTIDTAANTSEEFVLTEDIATEFDSVDDATDIITLTGDRIAYQTGDRVQLTTTGTLPSGLSLATNYYIIVYQRKDTPRILLASSLENAIAGTQVDITDSGTGTHTVTKKAEPRYFGGGVLKSDSERGNNLEEIVNSIAGNSVYSGGLWSLNAGEYQTPTLTYNQDDLAGAITVQTRVSNRKRFNRVQGVYLSPLNDGNPSDYPPVTNSTYETEDGEVIKSDVDLPFTQRPHTAQRIAKIFLERMRQEITFSAQFKLTAFKLKVGDNFFFNFDRYGWSSKVFEVIDWRLTTSADAPVIEMTCRENASAVYDWNSGEETQVDPAENTSLPTPFDVDPPTSLVVTPIETSTQQDDKVYEFIIDWTPPDDIFVTSGGWYEVEFKKSADATFRRSFRAEDSDTQIRITQVEPGVNYDCRIRAVNYLGVRSAYTTLAGFTVDSPSGATIQKDYLFFQGPQSTVTDSADYGLFSEAVDDTLDYGTFV